MHVFHPHVTRGLTDRLRLARLLRRFPERPVWAGFMFVNGFVTIALLAVVAMVSRTPFVFPSLGPTAFLFFFAPTLPSATPRHTILGHAVGIACGYGALWLLGLQHAPPALLEGVGWHRVLAAALSLATTGALMILLKVAHPMGAAGNEATTFFDCPVGYTKDSSVMNIVLCRQGVDEVVKVGRKGSAFWIDRYEASVWDKDDGTGKQYGAMMDDYPQTFPKNGQVSTPLYALSQAGVKPSANLTWFQANEACRANGKRLPTGDEWVAAARGTIDPGESSGSGGACVTSATDPRATGGGTRCTSDWGVQDMIGNVWEWTADWYAAPGNADVILTTPWPTDYNGDFTVNIVSKGISSAGSAVPGIPVAAVRGGDWGTKSGAGIFALSLIPAPSYFTNTAGFRCVVPR